MKLVKKQVRNRVFLYALVTLLLFSGISLLQWTDILDATFYYYLSLILVLVLGIIHAFVVNRLLPQIGAHEFWKGLGFTFLLLLLGAIAAGIIYYLLNLDLVLITFVLPFFLPYLCYHTCRFFAHIPEASYKTWKYPLNEPMPDLDMIDLTQVAVVQFVFHKKIQDNNPVNFTSKAPLDMTLGQLFFIFINDYNEKNSQGMIEFLTQQQVPHGWLFYKKHKWFKRRLYFDPELSFRQNAVSPNQFIYAQRIIALQEIGKATAIETPA